MNVATTYLYVEHVGGPYDGETSRVAADEDGLPPQQYLLDSMTNIDWSIDPMSGIQAKIATQFYERDLVVRDGDMTWVYVWKGEHVHDAAA